MVPSFGQILTALFFVYIGNSVWTMYQLYFPKNCPEDDLCLIPHTRFQPKIQLLIYTSKHANTLKSGDFSLVWKVKDLNYKDELKKELSIPIPSFTRKNGSLYCHIFVTSYISSLPSSNIQQLLTDDFTMRNVAPLTKYLPREDATFKLLGEGNSIETEENKSYSDPVSHWRTQLDINLMVDEFRFFRKAIPGEIYHLLRITPTGQYLPLLFIDNLEDRQKNYNVINDTTVEADIRIRYSPISLGKLRLWVQIEQSMETLKALGFSEKDTDEVKGIFVDTNFYLLMLTFIVAALHMLFDFLAFKNDISFWRSKKSMVGLSMRVVVWRCISQIIIFFYLMDSKTSMLVLVPAGIGSVIEMWKVTKALKVELKWVGFFPSIKLGSATDEEKKTEKFDSESMKYLSYVLYPLCIGGALYSLFYTPHKSWYSWCVKSLVNGVYAFGFLFMLPQLFVNYKLKSVAHLPWRAFMYKAFNTFIDDLFAFIITMPTAHRLACFRDDIVFIIYLYQKWLYPVDKLRANEYGESYDESKIKSE
ncbi:Cleft lip and palate transmembrane protein 1-like protein [Nymphon striatum]|nr:Cleft lip and palate transmembrane protein 1-like protein [Nymphon striatum]